MITVSNDEPPVRRSGWARSQTLPIVTSSVTPGAAAVRYPNSRLCPSRPASAPDLSWWRSHSCMARSGCTDTENRPGASSTSLVARRRGRPNSPASRSCWATSQTTVRLPRRAASRPRAAATVVLPTPPLPVTTTSRLSRSAGIPLTLA